jgi:hypothetical protein
MGYFKQKNNMRKIKTTKLVAQLAEKTKVYYKNVLLMMAQKPLCRLRQQR